MYFYLGKYHHYYALKFSKIDIILHYDRQIANFKNIFKWNVCRVVKFSVLDNLIKYLPNKENES